MLIQRSQFVHLEMEPGTEPEISLILSIAFYLLGVVEDTHQHKVSPRNFTFTPCNRQQSFLLESK